MTTIDINITVPQVSDAPTISVAELKSKVQAYVNSLFVRVDTSDQTSQNKVRIKDYSEKIQMLQEMSRQANITSEDLNEDDRLSYLLSK